MHYQLNNFLASYVCLSFYKRVFAIEMLKPKVCALKTKRKSCFSKIDVSTKRNHFKSPSLNPFYGAIFSLSSNVVVFGHTTVRFSPFQSCCVSCSLYTTVFTAQRPHTTQHQTTICFCQDDFHSSLSFSVKQLLSNLVCE